MKRCSSFRLLSVIVCLLCALPCGADSLFPLPVDQKTAAFLSRVLHSEAGQGIKPAIVVYVIPYVRPVSLPTRGPHIPIPRNKLYLITSADMFYSFLLTPTRVILEWQAKLVPLSDKTALHPYGTLGFLLMKRCKGIPNSVSGGKGSTLGAFLLDTDSRQPVTNYHVAKGKLVRDGELYY